MSVSIGLFGAGWRMRSVLGKITALDTGIRVASVYDPLPASHEAMRERLGYDYHQALTEEAVIAHPEVDWVFIGSWNAFHARQAVAALDAGKHVFCEKPLAISLEECLAIRDAVDRSGKQFVFGLVLRYSPHYQRLYELVSSGVIGRVLSFEFNETLGFQHGGYIFGNWRRQRAQAGTHLLEKCCHDLDLANWLSGSLPVRAASFGGRGFFLPENRTQTERIGLGPRERQPFLSPDDPEAVDPFGGSADIVDHQVAILEYANGIRATFHTNVCTAITERRFYLCGTEGTIRADAASGLIECRRTGWDSPTEVYDSRHAGGHAGGDEVMAEALVASMKRGASPLTSVTHGLHSAIAAFGIDQALDEGCVMDLRPLWRRAGIDPDHP